MIRNVILSNGKHAKVVTEGISGRVYYPDLPHCRVCDRSAAAVPLFVCDGRKLAAGGHGARPVACRAMICGDHVALCLGDKDYCVACAPGRNTP